MHHKLLRLCFRAQELQLLKSKCPRAPEPVLHHEKGHCNEKPCTETREESLLAATREKPIQQ